MTEPDGKLGTSPETRAQGVLQLIGKQALWSNMSRVDDLERALRAAARSALADEDRLAAAAIAHQLVGSAGTFGYRRVSELARELEVFFTDSPEGSPAAAEAASQRIQTIQKSLLAGPDTAMLD